MDWLQSLDTELFRFLNLRLVNMQGDGVSLKAAAIQSIGKSLLLPLDCLVGWFWEPCQEKRQRLFNKLSNTIVIFIGGSEHVVQKGEYAGEP